MNVLKVTRMSIFLKKNGKTADYILCVYLTPINFHKKGDGRGDDKGKGPR